MKNNTPLVLVLSLVCCLWGFCFRASAQTNGPFCDLCNLVTLKHLTEGQFESYKNDMLYNISTVLGQVQNNQYNFSELQIQFNSAYQLLSSFYGTIDQAAYEALDAALYNVSDYIYAMGENYVSAESLLNDMYGSLNSIQLTESEYCVSCSATNNPSGGDGEGDGDGDGDGGCCCNCPDYGPILEDIRARITSFEVSFNLMRLEITELKDKLLDWRLKWIAQDEKLTPILEELSPWLEKSKKFYSDYYDADWGSATWSNIKNIVSDITEKDIISDFDRLLNDYVGSSFSSDAWSAMAVTSLSWGRILSTSTGFGDDRTGEQTITKLLQNYSEQIERPYGSFSELHEVTEAEYKHLNWFQRVTVALGILAYPSTNSIANPSLGNLDNNLKIADNLNGSVSGYGDSVKEKFVSLFDSMKGVYSSFKDIVPADSFPTSIRIHGGWSFYPPGADSEVVAIPAVDWLTEETPTLQTACELLRNICGLAWSVLGFFLMFQLVRGTYGYAVAVVEKVLAVVGSMGRGGASGSSGV